MIRQPAPAPVAANRGHVRTAVWPVASQKHHSRMGASSSRTTSISRSSASSSMSLPKRYGSPTNSVVRLLCFRRRMGPRAAEARTGGSADSGAITGANAFADVRRRKRCLHRSQPPKAVVALTVRLPSKPSSIAGLGSEHGRDLRTYCIELSGERTR